MGLVIGAYYSGDPRVKPAPWGNASQVQSSIFANADREGIAAPFSHLLFWEKAGIGFFDYAVRMLHLLQGTIGTAYWEKSGFYFPDTGEVDGTKSIRYTPNYNFTGNGGYTVFIQFLSTTSHNNTDYLVSSGLQNGFYVRWHTANTVLYKIDDGANDSFSAGSISIPNDGLLHTLVMSDGDGRLKGYADGKIDIDISNSGVGNLANEVVIGGTRDHGTYRFGPGATITQVALFPAVLTPSQIAYLSDNPYFLLHRQPSVFYSVPSGAITLRQFGFQFYQDDADHTAIGTENDANVSLAPGSKFRIRMGIVKE